MKRYLIFALLGPLIGFLTGFYWLLPALNWATGGESTFDWHQISLLPLSYALGIVPALLAGAFDAVLAERSIHLRPLWTSLFGFFVSFLPLAIALLAGFSPKSCRPPVGPDRDGAGRGVLVALGRRAIAGRDADMPEESSKLKTLQTQQQLGVQALSIANNSS